MGHPLKKETKRKHTWQDYLSWPEGERWEVINGEAYNMSPSPTERHQTITFNLGASLKEKLKGSLCRVYVAPLDVYYDDNNFVQPDVFVVCDKNKIKDRIYGAPDLIVEVLSPHTSLKDKREKKRLYERFGVLEYIIVHPEEMLVERYYLQENKYTEPDIFGPEEILPIYFTEGIKIPLWEIFEIAPPENIENEY